MHLIFTDLLLDKILADARRLHVLVDSKYSLDAARSQGLTAIEFHAEGGSKVQKFNLNAVGSNRSSRSIASLSSNRKRLTAWFQSCLMA